MHDQAPNNGRASYGEVTSWGMRWNWDGTVEELVDGEWVGRRPTIRDRLRWIFRPEREPHCRTYFSSHGCRLRRGHPTWRRHRCSCGVVFAQGAYLFGEDVTSGV